MASEDVGYLTTLEIDAANGSSFATDVNIYSGGFSTKSSRGVVDTTPLNALYKTYQLGQMDGGTLEFTIACDYGSTEYAVLSTLHVSGSEFAVRINPGNSTSNRVLHCLVQEFGDEVPGPDDFIVTKVVCKVTGDPGHVTSGS